METAAIVSIIIVVIVVIALVAIIIIIVMKNKKTSEDENTGESTEAFGRRPDAATATFSKRKPSKEPYTVKEAKDINKKIDDYISQWIA